VQFECQGDGARLLLAANYAAPAQNRSGQNNNGDNDWLHMWMRKVDEARK
jgi:hypothetical protein